MRHHDIVGAKSMRPPIASTATTSESECAIHLLGYVFDPLLDRSTKGPGTRLGPDVLLALLCGHQPSQLAIRNQQLRVKALIAAMGSQPPSATLAAVNQLKRQTSSTPQSPMRPLIGLLDAYLSLRYLEIARARRALQRAVECAEVQGLVEIAVVLQILMVRFENVLGASPVPCFTARTFALLTSRGRSESMRLAAKLLLDQCLISLCVHICRSFKCISTATHLPALLPVKSLHPTQAQNLLDNPSAVVQLMEEADLAAHPISELLAIQCELSRQSLVALDGSANPASAVVAQMACITLALNGLLSSRVTRDQFEQVLCWHVHEGAATPELTEICWIASTALNRKDLSWTLLKTLSVHSEISKRARLRYASQLQPAQRQQRSPEIIQRETTTQHDAGSDILGMARIKLTRSERIIVNTTASRRHLVHLLSRLSLHPA